MAVENLVVISSPYTDEDLKIVFGDIDGIIHDDIKFIEDVDLSVIVKDLGIYPSTSKARNAGRVGPIPKGYTEYRASKKKKLYIWNPSE